MVENEKSTQLKRFEVHSLKTGDVVAFLQLDHEVFLICVYILELYSCLKYKYFGG